MANQKKAKGSKDPRKPKDPEHPDEPNEPYPEDEPYDDPNEHLEIERQRFQGGLPPTPELYALAREQWNRLPGSPVRPPIDPVNGESGAGEQQPQEQPDDKRGEK
jgi:hypothetical protein